MPTFRSFVELQRDLEHKVKSSLDAVGNAVWKELYDFIEQEIYIKNTLKISGDGGYERTYQFLESLRKTASVKIGNRYQYVIDFDVDKMEAQWRDNALFNSHMSVNGSPDWNGSSVASWMPQWLDSGNGGSPIYEYTGIRYMDFIKEFLRQNFNRLMKQELKSLGINVK